MMYPNVSCFFYLVLCLWDVPYVVAYFRFINSLFLFSIWPVETEGEEFFYPEEHLDYVSLVCLWIMLPFAFLCMSFGTHFGAHLYISLPRYISPRIDKLREGSTGAEMTHTLSFNAKYFNMFDQIYTPSSRVSVLVYSVSLLWPFDSKVIR